MLIHQIKKETAYIGKNKGKTVYYAAPVVQDKITTRQVEDRIINATALSRTFPENIRNRMTEEEWNPVILKTLDQISRQPRQV